VIDVEKYLHKDIWVYPLNAISRWAPTGEGFITYDLGGFDSDEVIEIYIEVFKENIPEGKSTLYWRKRPMLERYKGAYRVSSRSLFSDKPIMAKHIPSTFITWGPSTKTPWYEDTAYLRSIGYAP